MKKSVAVVIDGRSVEFFEFFGSVKWVLRIYTVMTLLVLLNCPERVVCMIW